MSVPSYEMGPKVAPPSSLTATARPRIGERWRWRMLSSTEPLGSCVSAASSINGNSCGIVCQVAPWSSEMLTWSFTYAPWCEATSSRPWCGPLKSCSAVPGPGEAPLAAPHMLDRSETSDHVLPPSALVTIALPTASSPGPKPRRISTSTICFVCASKTTAGLPPRQRVALAAQAARLAGVSVAPAAKVAFDHVAPPSSDERTAIRAALASPPCRASANATMVPFSVCTTAGMR
mmetsp:Transcript_11712/g.38748  ORF Transcript_11712/g.38748 Transcript_11712/m.38748 type:complete len:234 (-) Transcript_11712:119-820(-)